MDLATWLRRWLLAHPLKEHVPGDRARYTAEVMERVRTLGQPATAPRPAARWFAWPQVSLATAAVAAAVLLVVGRTHQPVPQLVSGGIEDDLAILAAVDEMMLIEATEPDDVDALADALETHDVLMLAEAPASDEQWVEETIQLLDEVGEEVVGDAAGEAVSEEWLEELELIDDVELSASS